MYIVLKQNIWNSKTYLLSVLGIRSIALTRTHIYSVKIYSDYVIVLYITKQPHHIQTTCKAEHDIGMKYNYNVECVIIQF